MPQTRCNDLPEALRIDQALEAMLAHLAQRQSARKLIAQEFRSGRRQQDLLAICGGHDARNAVDRGAKIIAIVLFGGPGMQTNPDFDGCVAPIFSLHDALRGRRRRQRV